MGRFVPGRPNIEFTHTMMDPTYTLDVASQPRWSVDDASARNTRLSQRTKSSFPARCDPLDPGAGGWRSTDAEKEGDRRYPAKCNPNRARRPLTEEQQDLATRYLPLARALASRMRHAWPGARDEFESAASLALVEAAQAFDIARGVNFATFARHRIVGALRDLRRDMYSCGVRGDIASARLPRFSRLGHDTEDQGQLIGAEPDEPVGAELEIADTIESWIRQLPRTHSLAFRHIYLDGKTQDEAAKLVGCSKAYMSRLHQEALTWLHQAHGLESTY